MCKMTVVIMIRLRFLHCISSSAPSISILKFRLEFLDGMKSILVFSDPRFFSKPTLNKKFLKTRKSFETRIFERRIFGQLVFIRRVSLLLKGIPSFRKVAICFTASKAQNPTLTFKFPTRVGVTRKSLFEKHTISE